MTTDTVIDDFGEKNFFTHDWSNGCTFPIELHFDDHQTDKLHEVIVGCNKRFDCICPPCAKKWQRKNLKKFKNAVSHFKDPRFLTFALRYDKKDLKTGTILERNLPDIVKRVRKRCVERGYRFESFIWAIEWPNHVHIVYDGGYIPQRLLSSLFKGITGDSFRVDIRRVSSKDPKQLGYYLASYTTKNKSFSSCPDISLLKGKRLVGTYNINKLPAPSLPWTQGFTFKISPALFYKKAEGGVHPPPIPTDSEVL